MVVLWWGMLSFAENAPAARRVKVEAKGKETRGTGTASVTVTAQLNEAAGGTRVTVLTDLAITGRPAQFGRGVMDDVGKKLLGQFADCVAARLSAQPAAAPVGTAGPGEATAEGQAPAAQPEPEARPTPDAINAFSVAGASVAKRLIPVLALIILVLIVVWALFIR
jgi:uncharacterized protein